jgi:aspartate 1-decarboxylase
MNGAAAKLIGSGEQVIIMGFEFTEEPVQPTVVLLDDENRLVRFLHGEHNNGAKGARRSQD